MSEVAGRKLDVNRPIGHGVQADNAAGACGTELNEGLGSHDSLSTIRIPFWVLFGGLVEVGGSLVVCAFSFAVCRSSQPKAE